VLALDESDGEAARAALARHQAQLADAQRIAQMGSWEWDLDTDVVRCSDELLRLTGQGPRADALAPDSFVALFHPDDRTAARDMLERVRAGAAASDQPLRTLRPDGSVRRLFAHAELIRGEGGAALRIVGTAQDVTDRYEAEARIERTHKAEAVARLAAGIAHDFNNLLTAIRCSADLLADSLPGDDERHGDVADIARASERAAGLTRQLLGFARQQVVEPRVLDLNALLTEFADILARALPEQIEQVMSLDPALGRVRADRDQLLQVVLALAMNARDAMPDGGVLLVNTANAELDAASVPATLGGMSLTPGPYVVLGVSDTGVGMDAETQARIFEPFFTTKAPGQGTGLGLASVYGIVKQAGGFIWARSRPGLGTRFTVYLPRVDEAAEPAATLEQAGTGDVRGDETVLVVEDEPIILDLATRVLRSHGYTVLRAAGGEEALATMAGHEGRVDLLVTDVVMPRMGGPTLAERLLAGQPDLRVLYMSGYTEGDIVRHRVLQRGVHLLEKPFTPRQLAERVRKVLDL
jgi:PAS domain S-box-containing protein